ncbi:MAG: molecular chaperone DnaK, partial [Acidimicrobiaceae bacterium]|nr:molecular chaperone DnaK [Acidimicrobiaceae bacterium]
MAYWLGLDVGTTFSAAAVASDGRVEVVSLGHHAAAVPSVLFLRDDGSFLVGDAAVRRGMNEPGRLARYFKRRFGDSTPVLLGGSPWSADALFSQVARFLVAEVAAQEGEMPQGVAVTHPANWGPFKTELLVQALRAAGVESALLLTEPEAAALQYAWRERVDLGDVVGIYDLGGGTFDAAVLAHTGSGFELLGQAEGIERLGGIDFDEAVFGHVSGFLGPALEAMDLNDQASLSGLARLRADCVEAKEALSADTDVSIPVLLPQVQTEIRLTRAEFEAMIRPTLAETTAALGRAFRSAGVATETVKAVLLVGGSSRIPLVGQLVAAEIGRPVAMDVHPKHAVALGAALAAAGWNGEPGSARIAAPGGSVQPPTRVATGAPAGVPAGAATGVPTGVPTGAPAGGATGVPAG